MICTSRTCSLPVRARLGTRATQLYHLQGAGAALPVLPFAVGPDDGRFWKAGLFCVNRADPAVAVPVRIGVGWTLNLGNPATWLIIGVIIATFAGLAVIGITAGL